MFQPLDWTSHKTQWGILENQDLQVHCAVCVREVVYFPCQFMPCRLHPFKFLNNLFAELTVHACNMFTHLKLMQIANGLLKWQLHLPPCWMQQGSSPLHFFQLQMEAKIRFSWSNSALLILSFRIQWIWQQIAAPRLMQRLQMILILRIRGHVCSNQAYSAEFTCYIYHRYG